MKKKYLPSWTTGLGRCAGLVVATGREALAGAAQRLPGALFAVKSHFMCQDGWTIPGEGQ